MKLPNDYYRCVNDTCPLRKTCARWTDRNNPNAMVFSEFNPVDGKCIAKIEQNDEPIHDTS